VSMSVSWNAAFTAQPPADQLNYRASVTS